MFVQTELEIQEALQRGLAEIREDPDVLHEIFSNRPDAERDEIIEYFASNVVEVLLAFPMENPVMPAYYVNLENATESDQPLGGLFRDDATPNAPTAAETLGTWFSNTVRVLCLHSNAKLAIWLSEVAKVILLITRLDLGGRGLVSQRMSLTGFLPLPEGFPSPAFRRDVLVNINTAATWDETWPRLRAITATAETSIQDQDGHDLTSVTVGISH